VGRLCVVVSALVLTLALPAPALASGPASGTIFWADSIGCGVLANTAEGAFWFGAIPVPNVTLHAGTLADDRVGWTCTGSVVEQLLPITTPLTLTGLRCVIENPFYEVLGGPRPGVLAASGTAIFYRNGNVRLICPPSQRVA
jgi:hypothetical protein